MNSVNVFKASGQLHVLFFALMMDIMLIVFLELEHWLQSFIVKDQMVNILGFVNCMFSVPYSSVSFINPLKIQNLFLAQGCPNTDTGNRIQPAGHSLPPSPPNNNTNKWLFTGCNTFYEDSIRLRWYPGDPVSQTKVLQRILRILYHTSLTRLKSQKQLPVWFGAWSELR